MRHCNKHFSFYTYFYYITLSYRYVYICNRRLIFNILVQQKVLNGWEFELNNKKHVCR